MVVVQVSPEEQASAFADSAEESAAVAEEPAWDSAAVVAESVSAADSALAVEPASSPVADSDKAWRSVARASLASVAA